MSEGFSFLPKFEIIEADHDLGINELAILLSTYEANKVDRHISDFPSELGYEALKQVIAEQRNVDGIFEKQVTLDHELASRLAGVYVGMLQLLDSTDIYTAGKLRYKINKLYPLMPVDEQYYFLVKTHQTPEA